MVNKPGLEATSEPSKMKSSSNSGKEIESPKKDRIYDGERGKNVEVYYNGENMKKDFKMRIQSLKPSDRKSSKDTTYTEVPHDHIAYRYECLHSLGKGSFGNVVLTIDHKTKEKCAVKVVRRDVRFTNQAQEEIKILKVLQKLNPDPNGPSPNFPIVQLIEHFMFREHMCLSFELLGVSLYDLIKDKKDQGLPRDRVRRLMSSVLDGLTYVSNAGIIHCDLKPENVLLVSKIPEGGGPEDVRDHVKIIDFGSSCFIGKQCYPYIQSRFYRAPEVILRLDYGQPIDIWSFGCLVFEMIRGYPLFPGEDEFDQLACLMEKLGIPPSSMVSTSRVYSRYFIDAASNQKIFDPLNKNTLLTMIPRYCTIHHNDNGTDELRPNLSRKTRRLRKQPGAVPVAQALVSTFSYSSGKYNYYSPTSSEENDNKHVVKLIAACLRWKPDTRITSQQAKFFSWFKYRAAATEQRSKPISQIVKSPNSPVNTANTKMNRTTSHTQLVTENLTTRKLPTPVFPNRAVAEAPVMPAPVVIPEPMPVVLAAPMPIVDKPETVKHSTGGAGVGVRKRSTVSSVSSTTAQPYKRGSPASISSGENKQEERVIYARATKSPTTNSFAFEPVPTKKLSNTKATLMKNTSDVSLLSLCEREHENHNNQEDAPRYTRRNGYGADRHPDSRVRKRTQSTAPKRHTQPVGYDTMPKERSAKPLRNYVTCKTTTINSSPEGDSQASGRHNPDRLLKNSTLDISEEFRVQKQNTPEGFNSFTKVRAPISSRSEVFTRDRRSGMTKSMSAEDFCNRSKYSSDESDVSLKNVGITPRSDQKLKRRLNTVTKEPKLSDPGTKSALQQTRDLENAQTFRVRSSKVLQSHSDHRRRQMPCNPALTSQLSDLNTSTNSRIPTQEASGFEQNGKRSSPLHVDSQSVLDITGTPRPPVMIKPLN